MGRITLARRRMSLMLDTIQMPETSWRLFGAAGRRPKKQRSPSQARCCKVVKESGQRWSPCSCPSSALQRIWIRESCLSTTKTTALGRVNAGSYGIKSYVESNRITFGENSSGKSFYTNKPRFSRRRCGVEEISHKKRKLTNFTMKLSVTLQSF